jgi:NAD(P)-dependent dehydrogenase (short-subunit alcohol dehydrogenase family)
MDISGRVALVVGGAGHIGSVACQTLAELGADVAVADLPTADGDALAARLAAQYGVEATSLTANLELEDQARALPEQTVEALGQLDILVHCAALVGTTELPGWAVPFENQRADTWRRAMEVNLTSAFVVCQAAEPYLRKARHGSIILVSSVYCLVGPDLSLYEGTSMYSPAAYFASKGGLLQLARWLASVLAPRTRVNVVSPGGIRRGQTSAFIDRYEAKTPLGRLGREDDLVGAFAYLGSDLSAYVTGQNVVVDGGLVSI